MTLEYSFFNSIHDSFPVSARAYVNASINYSVVDTVYAAVATTVYENIINFIVAYET